MSLFLTPRDRYATDAKAPLACGSCKRQKRKCDKARPACGLCTRMERRCDYAGPAPAAPTADDFAALQLKLIELEGRLNTAGSGGTPASSSSGGTGGGGGSGGTPVPGPGSASNSNSASGSAAGGGMEETPSAASVFTPLEPLWEQQASAQYPPDAFLDLSSTEWLNQSLPRPVIDIPNEVLQHLGDGHAIQHAVNTYFATIHTWLPIVSKKRMNMGAALSQGGPDLAMLFLAMKLAATSPTDVLAGGSQHMAIYRAAKRFMSLLEHSGATSVMVLQSMTLIAYFEYAHALYPAAWITVAACVRYADFLGLPGFHEGTIILASPTTWTELEERSRTWWAIISLDRIICLGNKKRYLSPEPQDNETYPVDDSAWDEGRVGRVAHHNITSPPPSPPSPFSSLCRSALIAGKIITHVRKVTSDRKQNPHASAADAIAEANALSETLFSTLEYLQQQQQPPTTGATAAQRPKPLSLLLLPSRCVLLSAGVLLHDFYCCPACPDGRLKSPEETAQQARSVDVLLKISKDVALLSEELLLLVSRAERDDDDDDDVGMSNNGGRDIGSVSPLILDALYGAANTLAWLLREEGTLECEDEMNVIKRCLERLGSRWRLAGEYGRMLEQQDFAMMMQEKGHSTLRII
ncbi:fungal specific transcription factor domain-containing protein [Colletotrichum scovillei]|uniref:Fungal specific transcription factor domain-containing protein n=1 Tax=Colletotrichum scovillei TaxID=1209932 RepID=A0A9P7QZH9_9PEZI|nr:fungal specific transcription factor domain-containing protein [Colletotrichum scovillei]KAF4783907.1 fungal specific transcription factor domain-containing protein [Colletotrichum scovillei]KAG7044851.1 fungal specific transcription factor domain-containing protein [Colletotrichum scovillei]KAG7049562.1 fungal specific transcription factor domain-containing protein [Colletotrichum scovillei]KAG7064304.1 fungal specific transcription factor domain-containing protein [Colletotrichum scovillei